MAFFNKLLLLFFPLVLIMGQGPPNGPEVFRAATLLIHQNVFSLFYMIIFILIYLYFIYYFSFILFYFILIVKYVFYLFYLILLV